MAAVNAEDQRPVVRMMAMQGSSGEDSYARNSSPQNYSFHAVAKPRLETALNRVIRNMVRARDASNVTDSAVHDGLLTTQRPPRIAIADLGCSHGRNTLDHAEFVLDTLQQNSPSRVLDDARPSIVVQRGARKKEDDANMQIKRAARSNEDGKKIPDDEMEISYFFSDLPSNDFNALFQSLQPYLYQSYGVCTREGHCALPKIFAAGVPGSFYGRLFPSSSLHLVICSYSLHWLSQVPPIVFDRSSLAWNGEHTWINKASTSVEHAYAHQSKLDMRSFLKCRSHELALGGAMFLFTFARAPQQDCLSSHLEFFPAQSTFELFDFAFKEMVDEGLLSLEEMEMFNVPMYMFDQQELECVLLDILELDVIHMETLENMPFFQEQKDRVHAIQQWIGPISSVMRPLLEAQLNKYKVDEVLRRIKVIASKLDCFDTTITQNFVIACLERRA